MAKKTVTKPAKAAHKKAAPKKVAAKSAAPKKTTAAKSGTIPAKRKPVKTGDALPLAKIIAQGMAERKAEDIRILDMRTVQGASADFFVISHAQSDKQVEAIALSVEEEVHEKAGEWPWHSEGYENAEWILLDYINVVAHVFQYEKRDFYAVEELWGDAEIVPFKAK